MTIERDIRNRMLVSSLSPQDVEVLEEIVYGPQTVSVSRLADQVDRRIEEISEVLEKLVETELFAIKDGTIIVDKEMRKYFETHIQKFEDSFSPGIEFLQALLKKVPIHVLPNWYPIPRASNNIFHSLIEKYLETPQIFQRYLTELNLGDAVLNGIVKDVLDAPDHRVYSEDIQSKYLLSKELLEKHLLHLEFNLVCCLVYERRGGEWIEVVTLFKEWKDYLFFLKESQPKRIPEKESVQRMRPRDFSFCEDLSTILTSSMQFPLFVRLNNNEAWMFEKKSALQVAEQCQGFDLNSEEGQAHFLQYIEKALNKLIFLKLARIEANRLLPTENTEEWLALPIDKRALNLYKETLAKYPFSEFSKEICKERNIREIEKSIVRIIDSGWVLFDEFPKGGHCSHLRKPAGCL